MKTIAAAAGVALGASASAYGVLRLVRLWTEREREATGYVRGKPSPIRVVGVDGKPVELATAAAFGRMRAAAAAEGVHLKVISGFRTMAEQEYFYGCYKSGACNNGNLAARPGYSNHQSGHALDLNAKHPAVGPWLRAHAGEYDFYNTVPSEPWHWEYWPQ